MGGAMGGLLVIFDRAGRILLSALVGREPASRSNQTAGFLRVAFGGAFCGFAVAAGIAGVLFAFDTRRYQYGEVGLPLLGGTFGGLVFGVFLLFLVDVLHHPDKPKDQDPVPK